MTLKLYDTVWLCLKALMEEFKLLSKQQPLTLSRPVLGRDKL